VRVRQQAGQAVPGAAGTERSSALEAYARGREAMTERRWKEAVAAFEEAVAADPDDRPSALMLERARVLARRPRPRTGTASGARPMRPDADEPTRHDRFYEINAQAFFDRSIDADMASGHGEFTALLPPRRPGAGRRLRLGPRRAGLPQTGVRGDRHGGLAGPGGLARAHTGLPVEVKTFDEVDWVEAFDGVWACASLLHVRPRGPCRLR
jgi:hypothetical protein